VASVAYRAGCSEIKACWSLRNIDVLVASGSDIAVKAEEPIGLRKDRHDEGP